MSLHRRNAKRDANEPPIVKRLRQMGADVYLISQRGIPDLDVVWRGLLRKAEVKGPNGRLTPDQEEFLRNWRGPPIPILETEDDATAWILSLHKSAAREAQASNRHHEATRTLEDS